MFLRNRLYRMLQEYVKRTRVLLYHKVEHQPHVHTNRELIKFSFISPGCFRNTEGVCFCRENYAYVNPPMENGL